jgi:hypothetical protein
MLFESLSFTGGRLFLCVLYFSFCGDEIYRFIGMVKGGRMLLDT